MCVYVIDKHGHFKKWPDFLTFGDKEYTVFSIMIYLKIRVTERRGDTEKGLLSADYSPDVHNGWGWARLGQAALPSGRRAKHLGHLWLPSPVHNRKLS